MDTEIVHCVGRTWIKSNCSKFVGLMHVTIYAEMVLTSSLWKPLYSNITKRARARKLERKRGEKREREREEKGEREGEGEKEKERGGKSIRSTRQCQHGSEEPVSHMV